MPRRSEASEGASPKPKERLPQPRSKKNKDDDASEGESPKPNPKKRKTTLTQWILEDTPKALKLRVGYDYNNQIAFIEGMIPPIRYIFFARY